MSTSSGPDYVGNDENRSTEHGSPIVVSLMRGPPGRMSKESAILNHRRESARTVALKVLVKPGKDSTEEQSYVVVAVPIESYELTRLAPGNS